MSDDNDIDLTVLLISWINQYGTEKKGVICVPWEREPRTEMYKTLINTLIEKYGYTKKDFGVFLTNKVMDSSMPYNATKKTKWRAAALNDWNRALAEFFPVQFVEHVSNPNIKTAQEPSYQVVDEDPRLQNEKLIDPSIFANMPPVNDPDDEEFLKVLRGET